jgi:hypothetical protein
MRTRIKVADLNLRQWDYLTTNVPVDGRDFLPGLPRVCAVFEVAPEISELHIEMDAVELAGLLVVLEGIRNDPDPALVAQAALTPDALPDRI